MSETGKAGALSRWEDEGGALPCGPQEALEATIFPSAALARRRAVGQSCEAAFGKTSMLPATTVTRFP